MRRWVDQDKQTSVMSLGKKCFLFRSFKLFYFNHYLKHGHIGTFVSIGCKMFILLLLFKIVILPRGSLCFLQHLFYKFFWGKRIITNGIRVEFVMSYKKSVHRPHPYHVIIRKQVRLIWLYMCMILTCDWCTNGLCE